MVEQVAAGFGWKAFFISPMPFCHAAAIARRLAAFASTIRSDLRESCAFGGGRTFRALADLVIARWKPFASLSAKARPAALQRAAGGIATVHGAQITGNHFFGANKATGAIALDDDAQGVDIRGNEFAQFDGYCVQAQSGASFDGINSQVSTDGVWDNSWTPSRTSLTVVNGTGGVTYSGT